MTTVPLERDPKCDEPSDGKVHAQRDHPSSQAQRELKTQWKGFYNSEYGQPSPLAYKLDTLIINRKLEEEGLVSEPVSFGVAETKARSLVKTHRKVTEAQIAAFPYRGEGKPKRTPQVGLSPQLKGFTLYRLLIRRNGRRNSR